MRGAYYEHNRFGKKSGNVWAEQLMVGSGFQNVEMPIPEDAVRFLDLTE